MYAIIETGGKQYRVKEGELLQVDKLNLEKGQEVIFDRVLFLQSEKGIRLGNPYLDGIKVKAEVVDEAKADKVMVYRPPSKKAIKKLKGHRQWYTKIRIKEIVGG
ncbi:50S ribosomal protein L21 [Thermodesulfovibrio sp.]|uniref:50S ribosomal protein L21 n=1 Tax=Thermodesulfovibrio sp. TaxID=2067987 RepID=UPI00309E27AB